MTVFDFAAPVLEDIYGYMTDIDINTSSCIPGINSKICKIILDKILSYFCKLTIPCKIPRDLVKCYYGNSVTKRWR